MDERPPLPPTATPSLSPTLLPHPLAPILSPLPPSPQSTRMAGVFPHLRLALELLAVKVFEDKVHMALERWGGRGVGGEVVDTSPN